MADEIDQIKQKIDLVEFIGQYLPLKKAGRNFAALCPFHTEKTPSFMISPERQIWRCFGCDKGGDIFSFLQEKEGLEFVEALEMLAGRAGVTLVPRQKGEKSEKEKLLAISELAAKFYQHLLWHPVGQQAQQYLQKRGINKQTAETFMLGFAPDSWELLTKFLTKKGFDRGTQAAAGLIAGSAKGEFFDRFRNRLIFPIKDLTGRVIGFAGRLIAATEDELKTANNGAKYINSPETKIFSKGSILFGLDLAKEVIQQTNEAILVEGEFDVLASYQAGVKNVVAVKGTALTERQVGLIKRFSETVIFCFDTDLAGDAAARRSIELADQAALNTKVIHLGKSKDPADLIAEDADKWKEAVSGAIGVYDFLIDSALRRHDSASASGKRKIGQELLPILAKISDDLVRAHYLKQLSLRLDLPEEVLFQAVNKRKPIEISKKTADELTGPENVGQLRRQRLEEFLLALLLQRKDLTYDEKILPEIGDITTDVLKKIYKAYIMAASPQEGRSFTLNKFIAKLEPEEQLVADRLSLIDLGEVILEQRIFERTLAKTTNEIKKLALKEKLKKVSQNIAQAEAEKDAQKLTIFKKRFTSLSERLVSLERK